MLLTRRTFGFLLTSAALASAPIVNGPAPAVAAEVGQPAPDFKLPSTTGVDISLGDLRGKKWVLLEFYGHDFVPT
jgi:cytochrome oxidase Cu insertion factor (SCO1/SenC/PrrC family)